MPSLDPFRDRQVPGVAGRFLKGRKPAGDVMRYAVDDDATIWVMTLPKATGGRYVHAVFTSETLAEEWAAENPRTCAGAQWEPFALHIPVSTATCENRQ
jgi:hypothetical protein